MDNFETCYDNYFLDASNFLEKLASHTTLFITIRRNSKPLLGEWNSYLIPELKKAEAIALFNYWSDDVFSNDPQNLICIEDLLKQVGYLPLAVILIAKRSSVVSKFIDFYNEWEVKKGKLLLIHGGETAKEFNLRLSVSLSYENPKLNQNDRILLGTLCVFPSYLGSARRFISRTIEDGYESIERLISASLINETGDGDLYIHPVIKDFVRSLPLDSHNYLDLFVEQYLSLAISQGITFDYSRIRSFWQWYGEDFENAIRHSLGSETSNMALISAPIDRFWPADSNEEMASFREIALADDRPNVQRFRGFKNLFRKAHDEWVWNKDPKGSVEQFEEALDFFVFIQNATGEAVSLFFKARVQFFAGFHSEAILSLRCAQPMFHNLYETYMEANCFKILGDIALRQARIEEAYRHYTDCRHTLGWTNWVGICIALSSQLCELAINLGDVETAVKHFKEIHKIRDKLHQRGLETGYMDGFIYKLLGCSSLFNDDVSAAEQYFGIARGLFHESEVRVEEENCLHALATILLNRGDAGKAEEYMEEAVQVSKASTRKKYF